MFLWPQSEERPVSAVVDGCYVDMLILLSSFVECPVERVRARAAHHGRRASRALCGPGALAGGTPGVTCPSPFRSEQTEARTLDKLSKTTHSVVQDHTTTVLHPLETAFGDK